MRERLPSFTPPIAQSSLKDFPIFLCGKIINQETEDSGKNIKRSARALEIATGVVVGIGAAALLHTVLSCQKARRGASYPGTPQPLEENRPTAALKHERESISGTAARELIEAVGRKNELFTDSTEDEQPHVAASRKAKIPIRDEVHARKKHRSLFRRKKDQEEISIDPLIDRRKRTIDGRLMSPTPEEIGRDIYAFSRSMVSPRYPFQEKLMDEAYDLYCRGKYPLPRRHPSGEEDR
mgnify:CR=1 FL=1